jgi:RNA polymerase sigma factor (sigma-70 family)
MSQTPVTQPSLLVRIRNPADNEAWSEFVEIYTPMIYRFLRKRGLQDADAGDLTQEVLRTVAGSIERLNYDRCRGTFRGWLLTTTRHKLYDFLGARSGQPVASGDTGVLQMLNALPSDNGDLASEWDHAYALRVFQWTSERIRESFQPNTWQAFWQTCVDGRPISEVARSLQITVGAVYIARSRVLSRLKQEVQRISDDAESAAELLAAHPPHTT